MITLADCRALDAADPLAALRAAFVPGTPGTLYFDGNSIGAMPAGAPARMAQALEVEWAVQRRRAWHLADWLDAPQRIGAAMAPLLGAPPEDVIAADNTTLNLHKLLAYGLQLAASEPDSERRRFIVYEPEGFPTDAHVVQGVVRHSGGRWAERRIHSPDELAGALRDDVAMVMLAHVDYRSSWRWPMAATTAAAHAVGSRVLWDCSHSAGAVPVPLADSRTDFAVACSYKYLSAGPGAPALAYIRRDLQNRDWPALPGWLGHADRMNFRGEYEPAAGPLSLITGTMPVLQNAVMECAARVWAGVAPAALHARHRSLSTTLATLMDEQCASLGVRLLSPADYAHRGGHLAFACPGGGPTCEALLESGVVTSFRQPDVIRFGLAPATVAHVELWEAVQRLKAILSEERWRAPRFQEVSV
ncbi:MAG: aminotransferase class V-fold PLP-dependent enzyme [Rubrivivax sp.]|nr:aminotransferase class V-fold PLP-dependent enzyme [Rubrivivax sp.]